MAVCSQVYLQFLFLSESDPDFRCASYFYISTPNREVSLDWVLASGKSEAIVQCRQLGVGNRTPLGQGIGLPCGREDSAGKKGRPGCMAPQVYSCHSHIWRCFDDSLLTKLLRKKCMCSSWSTHFWKFILKFLEVEWNHLQMIDNYTNIVMIQ